MLSSMVVHQNTQIYEDDDIMELDPEVVESFDKATALFIVSLMILTLLYALVGIAYTCM